LDETDIANMAALISKDDGMTNLSFFVEKNLKLIVALERRQVNHLPVFALQML
jgi:hypothetical protein